MAYLGESPRPNDRSTTCSAAWKEILEADLHAHSAEVILLADRWFVHETDLLHWPSRHVLHNHSTVLVQKGACLVEH